MPYSFVQIEQDKSRTIQFSVGFLFLLYFLAATLMVVLIKAYLGGYFGYQAYGAPLSIWSFIDGTTIAWTLGGSSLAGLVHFGVSTHAIIDTTLQMMQARLADLGKHEEQVFVNVVEEASVATGGKFRIEPWIIPTSAMNAFALQDFQGRSVIGITEGLLMRLNREQLEAVIAHEAGHIAAGDCKETTITSVLFKVFDNVCDVSFNMLRFSGGGRSRRGGGALPIILIVLVVSVVFKFVSVLGAFFISRQREYRADAIAARLTRNPKALAEALHIISHRWKGAGIPGQAMDAIFILSPRRQAIEDREGVFPDLFATHPPIEKRISILLDMASARGEDLEGALRLAQQRYERLHPRDVPPPQEAGSASSAPRQWMVMRHGQWLGPLDEAAVKSFGWVTSDTPLKQVGASGVLMAGAVPFLSGVLGGATAFQKEKCPRCNIPLRAEMYEGCPVSRCFECGGVLVSEQDTLTIVGRQEKTFDERIWAQARLIREQTPPARHDPFDAIYDERSIACPACQDKGRKMHRRFVSRQYPVEVDKCPTCTRVWFDKDEIEILQALYESDHSKGARG